MNLGDESSRGREFIQGRIFVQAASRQTLQLGNPDQQCLLRVTLRIQSAADVLTDLRQGFFIPLEGGNPVQSRGPAL